LSAMAVAEVLGELSACAERLSSGDGEHGEVWKSLRMTSNLALESWEEAYSDSTLAQVSFAAVDAVESWSLRESDPQLDAAAIGLELLRSIMRHARGTHLEESAREAVVNALEALSPCVDELVLHLYTGMLGDVVGESHCSGVRLHRVSFRLLDLLGWCVGRDQPMLAGKDLMELCMFDVFAASLLVANCLAFVPPEGATSEVQDLKAAAAFALADLTATPAMFAEWEMDGELEQTQSLEEIQMSVVALHLATLTWALLETGVLEEMLRWSGSAVAAGEITTGSIGLLSLGRLARVLLQTQDAENPDVDSGLPGLAGDRVGTLRRVLQARLIEITEICCRITSVGPRGKRGCAELLATIAFYAEGITDEQASKLVEYARKLMEEHVDAATSRAVAALLVNVQKESSYHATGAALAEIGIQAHVAAVKQAKGAASGVFKTLGMAHRVPLRGVVPRRVIREQRVEEDVALDPALAAASQTAVVGEEVSEQPSPDVPEAPAAELPVQGAGAVGTPGSAKEDPRVASLLGDLPPIPDKRVVVGSAAWFDATAAERRAESLKVRKRVPDKFRCALSGRVVIKPLRSPHGHVFDQQALEEWVQNCGSVCPITNQPLRIEDCERDTTLEGKAAQWLEEVRREAPKPKRRKRKEVAPNTDF